VRYDRRFQLNSEPTFPYSCTCISSPADLLLVIIIIIIIIGARDSVLVKTLCYKLKGRGFDTR
jgi:hypothetical protein